MIIETVFASEFGDDAVERMTAAGNGLIDSVPLERPILCTLYDACGEELCRFSLGLPDPTDAACDDPVEAELRSQNGASLRMVDRNGTTAEVLLVIGVAVEKPSRRTNQ
jgi:hypothetical protein